MPRRPLPPSPEWVPAPGELPLELDREAWEEIFELSAELEFSLTPEGGTVGPTQEAQLTRLSALLDGLSENTAQAKAIVAELRSGPDQARAVELLGELGFVLTPGPGNTRPETRKSPRR